jgi:hypothetical protein
MSPRATIAVACKPLAVLNVALRRVLLRDDTLDEEDVRLMMVVFALGGGGLAVAAVCFLAFS